MLNLKNEYEIIFKSDFDENDSTRELLFVHKNYLNKLNNNHDNNNSNYNNGSDNKNNKNKNDQSNKNKSEIVYITIKKS